MKKLLPYAIFSAVSLIVVSVLSIVFSFSLTNTWQGMVSLIPIMGPFYVLVWKLTKEYKKREPLICFFVRFFWIASVLVYAIVTVLVVINIL